jgi:small subunit ribosomal protein S16
MATVIRLSRTGTTKKPFYRIVVADSRKKKEGRIVECIGHVRQNVEPAQIKVNQDKALSWLKTGATPSPTVKRLLKKVGIWAKFLEAKKAPKTA